MGPFYPLDMFWNTNSQKHSVGAFLVPSGVFWALSCEETAWATRVSWDTDQHLPVQGRKNRSWGRKPKQWMLFYECSQSFTQWREETTKSDRHGKVRTGQFPVASWCPQPGTHGLFLPQSPKSSLKICVCNLTSWPQNSSSEISLGLKFLHLLALGKHHCWSSRDLSWCSRQYPVAWKELLCTYRFTQPHWGPAASIRYVLITLKNMLQLEKCGQKSHEKQHCSQLGQSTNAGL